MAAGRQLREELQVDKLIRGVYRVLTLAVKLACCRFGVILIEVDRIGAKESSQHRHEQQELVQAAFKDEPQQRFGLDPESS